MSLSERQSLDSPRASAMNRENDNPSVANGASNDGNVEGINYALQRTRWFLTILGIWPHVTEKPTRMDRYVWTLFSPIPPLFLVLALTGVIFHTVMRDLHRLEVIAAVGRIVYLSCNILKNVVLLCRCDAIKRCFQHMESDWRRIEDPNEIDIMTRNLGVGRGLSAACFICMYGSAVFFDTMPLYTGSYVNEHNKTVRPLVFPGADLFVDISVGRNYAMVYCCNNMSAFFLHFIVCAVCDVAAILVSHACGQIQIVMYRLESLVRSGQKDNDIADVERRIAFIIQTHVRTLRFGMRIDELLQEIFLLEIFGSTLIICWFEYFCLSELENGRVLGMTTYLLFLISVVFNTFIFCHIGEILKEQCQQIGNAAYMIEWFELPGKSALTLLMVIAISNYPRKLTAGRIMEMSHDTFGTIMRTSLAYLNMLRQVGG